MNPQITFPGFATPFTLLTALPSGMTQPPSSPQYTKLLGAEETLMTSGLFETDVNDMAMLAIENKRRALMWATRAQMEVHRSETLADSVMAKANPAERAWLKRVADRLQSASLTIFGRQSHHNYEKLAEWMTLNGDTDSRFHFDRMRVTKPPEIERVTEQVLRAAFETFGAHFGATDVPLEDYMSVFPWFEEKPAFNGMLPAGMNDTEKEYLSGHYDAEHPIRLPWTVVEDKDPGESIGEDTKDTIVTSFFDGHEIPIRWHVRGKGEGQWYTVTNIAHHPEFRKYFREIVQVLRESIEDTSVGEYDLHPKFKQYIANAAEAIEAGDFRRLLKADMEPPAGNLFFTFFPHEGYWPDGIKFPFMFETGIMEPVAAMTPAEAQITKGLEERVIEIAQARGLPYQEREFGAEGTVLLWPYRTGGFMRAFYREPLGHDYPKRQYEGIGGHRTVILLDAGVAGMSSSNAIVDELIGNTFLENEDMVEFAAWHERTHGTGARPDTPTNSGRTMSDVYGDFWGDIAEPLADAGSLLSIEARFKAGLISKEARDRKIRMGITFQLRRFVEKEKAAGIYLGHPEAPHLVGSNMLLGKLFAKNAIGPYEPEGVLSIDEDRVIAATQEFFDELTVFSLTDNLAGLKSYITYLVHCVSAKYEAAILAAKGKHIKPILVNRNPEEGEMMTRVL